MACCLLRPGLAAVVSVLKILIAVIRIVLLLVDETMEKITVAAEDMVVIVLTIDSVRRMACRLLCPGAAAVVVILKILVVVIRIAIDWVNETMEEITVAAEDMLVL